MDRKTLTATEERLLQDCESKIRRGLEGFVEMGAALFMVREKRLFRTTAPTFDAWCRAQWGFSSKRAAKIIRFARVAFRVGRLTGVTPHNSEQVDLLTRGVAPAKQGAVWKRAVAIGGGQQPTGPQVRRAKVEVTGYTRAWPGSGVKFVKDLDIMAERLAETFSPSELHHLVALLMAALNDRYPLPDVRPGQYVPKVMKQRAGASPSSQPSAGA